MYCAKCGTVVTEKLNYCNSCGEKLTKDKGGDSHESVLSTLLKSIGFISVAGLGLFVGLVAVLLNKGMTHEAVAIISGCYLATLFGICFSLTRLMSKLIDIKPSEKAESLSQSFQTPQLVMPTNPQLGEYQQPIGSVTDHTTRTFDEVLIKRS